MKPEIVKKIVEEIRTRALAVKLDAIQAETEKKNTPFIERVMARNSEIDQIRGMLRVLELAELADEKGLQLLELYITLEIEGRPQS